MSPSADHSDIGPELRQLAQALLERLDPALRAAAAMSSVTLTGPGRCQQVWCPVCALAALVRGEQHPLLALIAEHSVTLLEMVRAMAADSQGADRNVPPPPPPSANGSAPGGNGSPSAGRYEHIPIVVEPPVDSP